MEFKGKVTQQDIAENYGDKYMTNISVAETDD